MHNIILSVRNCKPSAIVVLQYLTISGQNAATVAPRTCPETGRQRVRPKHPDYAQLQQQRTSFQGKQVPAGQRVEVLALAGFFHVGEFLVKYICIAHT